MTFTRGMLLAMALAFSGTGAAVAADDTALQASPPGCINSSSSPAQRKAAGEWMAAELLAPRVGAPSTPPTTTLTFGRDIGQLAQENVFGDLWARCGLSRRDRSLVTLGILIALRAENELRYHFPIAIRNGLTRSELEEVIYQSAAYAGFPAAASARSVAQETLPAK